MKNTALLLGGEGMNKAKTPLSASKRRCHVPLQTSCAPRCTTSYGSTNTLQKFQGLLFSNYSVYILSQWLIFCLQLVPNAISTKLERVCDAWCACTFFCLFWSHGISRRPGGSPSEYLLRSVLLLPRATAASGPGSRGSRGSDGGAPPLWPAHRPRPVLLPRLRPLR